MNFKGWLARINGVEFSVIPGFYWSLVGYMRDSESDAIALGLGVARVLVRWSPAPKPEVTVAPETPSQCPVCSEPILEGDAATPLPVPPLFSTKPVRAHEECYVFMRHGRAACQRGECPNCDPPKGQSIREQARDAAEFYKASKGRTPSKKREAVS
jgi:hypothetical protein